MRRLLRRWGYLAIGTWAWKHRGTVVRVADALRRAPARVRSDGLGELATELRAIATLDRTGDIAARTDLRIGAVGEGSVELLAPAGDPDLAQARQAVLDLRDVVDVRATDPSDPAVTDRVRAPVPGSPGVLGEEPNRMATDARGRPATAPLDEAGDVTER